jgi:long-subunit fatty acid transport protein
MVELFEGVPYVERLAFAISPRYSEMELKSHTTRYDADFDYTGFPYPTDFSDEQIVDEARIDDKDSTFSVNFELLWEPHPKISFGVVYRSGPKFEVIQSISSIFPTLILDNTFEEVFDFSEVTLKIPDAYGVGIKWQAKDTLIFTFDVVHIEYEDLLEDFDSLYRIPPEENFTVDNVTEIHLGVEYTMALGERRFLALRAGTYYEPDHIIRFTGTTGSEVGDIFSRTLYPGGEDQIHVSGGLGLAIGKHFQIDTAVDVADQVKQLSVSAIYRF